MDQSSKIIRRLERERFRESISQVEMKLEELKKMYQNYKENSETLQDDAMSALDDTTRWIEQARRLHIEAGEAKQRELRLRNHIKNLEKEASQTRRQSIIAGGEHPKTPGNPSRMERIKVTCVTCVGSVLVYGLFKLTAPFLI